MKPITFALILLAAGCASAPEIHDGLPLDFKGEALQCATVFQLDPAEVSAEAKKEDTHSFLGKGEEFQKLLLEPVVKKAPALFSKVAVLADGEENPVDAARRKRADLLVRLTPVKHDITYVGHNSWWVPNLGIWFFTWFGAWYVPDETWAADLEMELSVIDTKTGKPILTKTLSARQELRLNDFQRGWNFFGTFLGPPDDEDTYRDAAEHIQPFAFKRLNALTLEALAIDLRKVLDEKGWKPVAETVALVLASKDANASLAEKDGQAFADLLGRMGVRSGDTRFRKGSDAKGARLEKELNSLSRFPFPERMRAIVYFAGSGFTDDKGQPCLGTPAKSVPLSRLIETLGKFKDAVLIVDAGFGGPNKARSTGKTAPGETSSEWEKLLKGAAFPILMAAQAGGPALEADDLGHGVFTGALLDGLKGSADLDGNKKVSLGELKKFIASQVRGYSTMMGKKQQPVLVGGDDTEALFSR